MNFMEKKVLSLFLLVLVICAVSGVGEWGDMNVNSSDDDVFEGDVVLDDVSEEEDVLMNDDFSSQKDFNGGDGKFYTVEFWIAMVLVVLVLIIVFVLIWLFVRSPKNDWEKSEESFFDKIKIKIKK